MNQCNLSIYISNNIDINHANFENNTKCRNLELTKIHVDSDEDLVIEGLCFIKVSNDTIFEIYIPKGTSVYTRDKIIG